MVLVDNGRRLCAAAAACRYQLADWRVRPLSEDMLHYARCDTHFLLHVADAVKRELIAAGDMVPEGWRVDVPQQAGTDQVTGGLLVTWCVMCVTFEVD